MSHVILYERNIIALRLYVARIFNGIYGENHVKKGIALYHFFNPLLYGSTICEIGEIFLIPTLFSHAKIVP